MNEILDICKRAKAVCGELLRLDSRAKFEILNAVADELLAQKEAIKAANAKDLANGMQISRIRVPLGVLGIISPFLIFCSGKQNWKAVVKARSV